MGDYKPPFTDDELSGKMCHYCNTPTIVVDSTRIYIADYNQTFYLCPNCYAYVGCHKKPPYNSLGVVANKVLRQEKTRAHLYFDVLWRSKLKPDNSNKKQVRTAAYKWLSEQMGIPMDYCHIGMFNIEQCMRVIEICYPYAKKILN